MQEKPVNTDSSLSGIIHAASSLQNYPSLSMEDCQCFADCILYLKQFKNNWLNNNQVLTKRIEYFFMEEMGARKEEILVFMTFPVFLPDILESCQISRGLHRPLCLVSKQIAHFLFQEYPVLLCLDYQSLKKINTKAVFHKIGALTRIDNVDCVHLDHNSIKAVLCRSTDEQKFEAGEGDSLVVRDYSVLSDIKDIERMVRESNYQIQKTAASCYDDDEDHYKLDTHHRNLWPGTKLLDRRNKKPCSVLSVEPGDAGEVQVRTEEGKVVKTDKNDFDLYFTIVASNKKSQKRYDVVVNDIKIKMTEPEIEKFIKEKLGKSKVVQKMFQEFGVDIDGLKDLKIRVKDLKKRYAETDDSTITINSMILDSKDFLDNFFIIIHELTHWLTRKAEDQAYFNDPEEVFGFLASLAYERELGTSEEDIYKKVYPKIEWHFSEDADAQQFYDKMLEKSRKFYD